MGSKQGTSGSGGGGGQDRGQNVTHQDMAAERKKQQKERKQKKLSEGKKLLQNELAEEAIVLFEQFIDANFENPEGYYCMGYR